MAFSRSRVPFGLLVLPIFLLCFFTRGAGAQGIPQTPYRAANEATRLGTAGGLDLTPSNPLGMPGSPDGSCSGF